MRSSLFISIERLQRNRVSGTASECYRIIIWKYRIEYVKTIEKKIGRQVSQATVVVEALAMRCEAMRVVVEGKFCGAPAGHLGGDGSAKTDQVRIKYGLTTDYIFYLVGTLLGRYRLIKCKIRLSRYFTMALFMTIIWRSEILFQYFIRYVANGFHCLGLLSNASLGTIHCQAIRGLIPRVLSMTFDPLEECLHF